MQLDLARLPSPARTDPRTIFYTGFFGGLALAAAIIVYKPDTSCVCPRCREYMLTSPFLLPPLPISYPSRPPSLLYADPAPSTSSLLVPTRPHCPAPLALADALAPHSLALLAPNSIQAWALQEAKQRMEARGESVKYEPSQ